VIIRRLIAARGVAGGLTRLAIAGTLAASGVLVMAQAAQASWLEVSLPNPPGTISGLNDISCTSPTVCMAVGTSDSSTNPVLAESRNGSSWAIQNVAQPPPGSSLNGISCTSASACIAVGTSPKDSTGARPLAERWNGLSWTILGAKDVATATRTTLDEVSCVSATRCLAVGESDTSVRDVPLAELWNGSRWRIVPAPAVRGRTVSLLSGISCTSATRCIAVGYSLKSGNFATLAELWNGKAWKIIASPTAVGASFGAVSCKAGLCEAVGGGVAASWNGTRWSKLQKLANPGGTPASLGSVSCTVKHTCYASGSYYLDAVQTSVVEYFNGTRWTVQNADITTSNDSSGFGGVSCATTTRCTLVGFYHDPDLGNQALAMDFSLRWQDVSPVPVVSVNGSLGSVSCWSPQSCIAVGFDSSAEPFVEAWSGGSWYTQIVPKPKVTDLNAVSCPAKSNCLAVGSIVRNGVAQTLAEHWNGISWTIQRTPNPAESPRSFLLGVSCTSKSACTAVGFATRVGHQVALAERWNGKNWQIEATPSPKGKESIQLNSVSCTSSKACTAVGTYVIGKFAETWNGTSWKLHAVPTPTGGTQAVLEAVSCTSAKACTAVGQFNRGGKTLPLAERWNGISWKPQHAVPGGTSSAFSSVSCTAANVCTAVGNAGSTAVAETWNGKSWAVQGVQSPVLGSDAFGLNSVWCNSPIACMSVGNYVSTSATQLIFAEQYS
jgi:hypothetical protein